MGVPEDINWLKENVQRSKTFALIATGRALKIRDLRQRLNSEDWWPVKQHVKDLINRGLILEANGNYRLTESGQKVLESLRAVRYLEEV
jgi:predicted transcriptional regulator